MLLEVGHRSSVVSHSASSVGQPLHLGGAVVREVAQVRLQVAEVAGEGQTRESKVAVETSVLQVRHAHHCNEKKT